LNSSCSTGLFGVCSLGTRYQYCNAGVSSYTWTSCSQTFSPSPEVCDALDNDCDGVVNNDLPNLNLSTPCSTGLPGVCSAGTKYLYCNAAVSSYTWSSCIQTTNSSPESAMVLMIIAMVLLMRVVHVLMMLLNLAVLTLVNVILASRLVLMVYGVLRVLVK